VWHILQLIEPAIGIRNFKAVAHMAITHECIRSRINHHSPVNYHPVVVKSLVLRLTGVGPEPVFPFDHVERNIDNGYLHLLCIGSIKAERNP